MNDSDHTLNALSIKEREMLIHAVELTAHASMSISGVLSVISGDFQRIEHPVIRQLVTILEMQEAVVRDLSATLNLSGAARDPISGQETSKPEDGLG